MQTHQGGKHGQNQYFFVKIKTTLEKDSHMYRS